MKSTKTSATWSSEDREAKTGLKGTRRIAPIGGLSLQISEFQRQVKFKVRLVVRVAALSYEGSICLFLKESQPLVIELRSDFPQRCHLTRFKHDIKSLTR